ncbi:MAG: phage tail protein [Bradyrhizobium sp.]|nr:phage tail protein [Bradyrhizobium sp.]
MAVAIPLIAGYVGTWAAGEVGVSAAVGWAIGSSIGSIIERKYFGPDVAPNALTDLQVQTSSWGVGLPQVFGTQRLAGNIIWSTDKILVGGNQGKFGGKGGGGGKGGAGKGKKGTGSQGYYVVAIAFALAEGPIGGIKRIWAGGDLIFDDGAPVYVPSMDQSSPQGGYQTFTANNQPITSTGGSSLGTWTLYHGTNLQTADPTIAANGSANGPEGVPYQQVTLANGFEYTYGSPQFGKMGTACAYRGIAYIVFDALNCGYGGTIPPLTFEVVGQPGTLNAPQTIAGPFEVFPSAVQQFAEVSPGGDYAAFVKPNDSTYYSQSILNLRTGEVTAVYNNEPYGSYGQQSVFGVCRDGASLVFGNGAGPFALQMPNASATIDYAFTRNSLNGCNLFPTNVGGAVWIWDAYAGSSGVFPGYVFQLGSLINYDLPAMVTSQQAHFPVIAGIFYYFSGTTLYACQPPVFTAIATTLGASPTQIFTDGITLFASVGSSIYSVDTATGVASLYMTPSINCNTYAFANGYLFGVLNNIVYKFNANGTVRYSTTMAVQGASTSANPIIPSGNGILISGKSTGSGTGTWACIVSFGDTAITPVAPTLPLVLQAVCSRAGFTNTDVSLVPALPVNLTRRAGNSARDVLKVLCQVYQMDMVDSAGTLRFVPKGQNIAAQLEFNDIGYGKPVAKGAQPPAPYVFSIGQGTDLPRSVTFKYTSALTNYNPNSQFFQLHDPYGKDVAISVPLTLDDRTALTAAMLMCVEPHIERTSYSWTLNFATGMIYEPGDVLQMPWGVTRITQVTIKDGQGNPTWEFRGVLDASYVINSGAGMAQAVPIPQIGQPNATQTALPVGSSGSLIATQGQPSSTPGQVPTRPPLNLGAAYASMVEVPPLQSTQTSPFYLAIPYTSGSTFVGVAIYESTDGGVTFNEIAQQAISGIAGYATQALPDTQPYTWDTVTTLSVYLSSSYMQLSSATDLQVIQGANLALIGTELIQFGVAQLLVDGSGNSYYQLSRLLRGRRGTEWAMAGHAPNENFTLISPTQETTIPYGLHDLNNAAEFKVATVGQSLSVVGEQSFAPTGIWFKPFSAVHFRYPLDSSGNWNLSFTPRARLNGWWGSGYSPSLDPDTQTWSLDVQDYYTGQIVRTVGGSLSSPSFQYTAAMQTADGFTPGQHGIIFNLYQVSSVIGRGYVNTVTT